MIGIVESNKLKVTNSIGGGENFSDEKLKAVVVRSDERISKLIINAQKKTDEAVNLIVKSALEVESFSGD